MPKFDSETGAAAGRKGHEGKGKRWGSTITQYLEALVNGADGKERTAREEIILNAIRQSIEDSPLAANARKWLSETEEGKPSQAVELDTAGDLNITITTNYKGVDDADTGKEYSTKS